MKKALRFLPAIVWMLVIFLLSNEPGPESYQRSKILAEILSFFGFPVTENGIFFLRKLAHFSVYFILTVFFFIGFCQSFELKKAFLISFFSSVLYASSDEFHQRFVPNRVGTPTDVLVDSFGALVAILVIYLFLQFFSKKSP